VSRFLPADRSGHGDTNEPAHKQKCGLRMKCSLKNLLCSLCLAMLGLRGQAQQMDHSMPGMNGLDEHHEAPALIPVFEQHAISGSDVEAVSTPSAMLMHTEGSWTFMFHGEAFLNELQQSGPRGADKFFSTNWFMPMAQRKAGKGLLSLRSMVSLEPATVSDRRYPELFQQGETAYGKAIVDGQHPHDFFMELAAMFDYNLNEHTAISFYAAPVGDPAMGPPAYPHRASASEDPVAPLGHHLEDSTHIADDVVTVGLTYRIFRIEASGFHGREPDEYRWDIDSGAIDSWSARVTLNPGANWSFQYSLADLRSPEELNPAQDIRRMTAAVIYNLPLHNGNWASMALWGRNESLQNRNVGNAYLLESTLRFCNSNYAWLRIENVDRTTELLLNSTSSTNDAYFTRVQAYTAGYDREVGHIPHLSTAVGGQVTWYGVPNTLRNDYGTHPLGALVFLRLRAH
jgi:hypothetical protein